jgi:hypothetical protein
MLDSEMDDSKIKGSWDEIDSWLIIDPTVNSIMIGSKMIETKTPFPSINEEALPSNALVVCLHGPPSKKSI